MTEIVLGVDPGIALTGWGLVKSKRNNKYCWVASGCIKTDKNLEHAERLKLIYHSIVEMIHEYQPSSLALEKVFFNKNTRTALAVGEARGVIILASALNDTPVYQYTPLQVKNSVSGDGRADKLQIQKMVCLQLRIKEKFKHDDEADALAVALCHQQYRIWHSKVSGEKNIDRLY